MRGKQYILSFLLFVSLIIVGMPVIPHHHHGDNIICMKDDIKESDCCNATHHHHQEDDPCCSGGCTAHLDSYTVTDTDSSQPEFFLVTLLFPDPFLRLLTCPEEDTVHSDSVYRESLHGTYLTRATGLRAPPSLV